MASQTKLKKSNSHFSLCTFLFFTIPALFLLRSSSCSSSSTAAISSDDDTHQPPSSGDLQTAQFAWNRLAFSSNNPPLKTLKLAVFTRKWPTGPNPGGMERHAFTLYTALARRGHQVHVFTSPLDPSPETNKITPVSDQTLNPKIHSHGDADPGKPDEPRSQGFNASLYGAVLPKILGEIRFFHNYAHHIAISDSCGEKSSCDPQRSRRKRFLIRQEATCSV